jgi:hypothetical protein
MLASSGGDPSGDGWAAEVKWDGLRIVATVTGGTLSLHSRHGSNATDWFPEVAELPPGLGTAQFRRIPQDQLTCRPVKRPASHGPRGRDGRPRDWWRIRPEVALFMTEQPSRSDVERARRKLDELADRGLLRKVKGTPGKPDRYLAPEAD